MNNLTTSFIADTWKDYGKLQEEWRSEILASVRKTKIDIILGGKTVEEKTDYIIDNWFKKKEK